MVPAAAGEDEASGLEGLGLTAALVWPASRAAAWGRSAAVGDVIFPPTFSARRAGDADAMSSVKLVG
jgi:hypothetical protein